MCHAGKVERPAGSETSIEKLMLDALDLILPLKVAGPGINLCGNQKYDVLC